jgi:hypothetical protein
MNASVKKTLRLGITAGLSLGAIVGLVGCGELMDGAEGSDSAAVLSANGLSFNGFGYNGFVYNGFAFNGLSYNGLSFNGMSFNGMSFNGLSYNGLSYNGLSFNGLSSAGGLSETSGLMTTDGGREFVKYMVKCAYPSGRNLVKGAYTFPGALGIAPEAEFGACDSHCQEKISSCMLAHVNNSGLQVGIWLVGPDAGIGWGSSPDFPYMEAAYYGNLFAPNMPGNYCAGKHLAAGNAKGRLGSPFGNGGVALNSPHGWLWDEGSAQNVPQFCSLGCTAQNEGYSSCTIPGQTFTHPITVYRNFEKTQVYKICNRNSGKCLGVVGGSTASGANIEQRTFTAAKGQTWRILQVSPGNYKLINHSSGMSLDVNGTQVIQKAYTSQAFPISYFADLPGFSNVKLASNQAAVFWTNWSTSDGALIKTITGQSGADAAKWSFIAIGLDTFDPGMTYRLVPQHATNKSMDVAYNAQTNGTAVNQYGTYNTDGQKFFIADAGKGNVKLTMKVNKNKCLGTVGNSTASGTKIEIQDCNASSYTQAWITGKSPTGIISFQSAAAPNKCLDVTGNVTTDGARMEIWDCHGQSNQLFSVQAAP